MFALLGLDLGAASPALSRESGPQDGRDLISPDSLMSYVRWLADDAREGRMTGSPGGKAAADWIAARFEAAGLSPGGNDGTFLRRLADDVVVEVIVQGGNEVAFTGHSDVGELRVKDDFAPFPFSENGSVEGSMVFAGYGITAPDLEYDDYEGIDVEGKVVLILRHEPQQKDEESVFNGTANTRHALFTAKAKNAAAHGAVGMILFTGPGSRQYRRDRLVFPHVMEKIRGIDLVAVQVKNEVGEALLEQAGIDVEEWVEAVDDDLEPRSKDLDPGITATLSVFIDRITTPADNVIGVLPGTDPDAGAVILGAHYDHLGFGNRSSMAAGRIGEIHNGADDNASGTAGLVELARVFAALGPTRRTLVFAAFTGEELGLHGSEDMASSIEPVPMDQVQIMINMDMIGRLDDKSVYVGGLDSAEGLDELVNRAVENSTLTISASADTRQERESQSDHDSFRAVRVPYLFFFSGLHTDYHEPGDDWNKIDRDGITEITRMVYTVASELADRDERLKFRRGRR